MRDVNISSIRSVDRAIDILQAFSVERPSLTVEDFAKITGIPKSTVYRVLCTLERRGLVQFEKNLQTYKPGLRLMEFGVLSTSVLDIRQVAEEVLIDLHNKTTQTILMAVKEGDEIIYIYKRENYEGLKFSSVVGQRRPFIYGVLGPILLAYSSESQIQRVLENSVSKHTPYTVTEKGEILKRLEKIREEGFYLESNETNIGVTGLSSPVFGINGEIAAAIGVIGPMVQLDDQIDKVKPILIDAAKKISVKMGYQGKKLGVE
jgi:IclR family KDG regulon transcriptional repressor